MSWAVVQIVIAGILLVVVARSTFVDVFASAGVTGHGFSFASSSLFESLSSCCCGGSLRALGGSRAGDRENVGRSIKAGTQAVEKLTVKLRLGWVPEPSSSYLGSLQEKCARHTSHSNILSRARSRHGNGAEARAHSISRSQTSRFRNTSIIRPMQIDDRGDF